MKMVRLLYLYRDMNSVGGCGCRASASQSGMENHFFASYYLSLALMCSVTDAVSCRMLLFIFCLIPTSWNVV